MSSNVNLGPTSNSPGSSNVDAPERPDTAESEPPTCKPVPSTPYEPPPVDTPGPYQSLQAQDRCDQGYERAHFDGPGNTFSVGDCINSDIANQAADLTDNRMAQNFFNQLSSQDYQDHGTNIRNELSILDAKHGFSMDDAVEILELSDAAHHRLENILGSSGEADEVMEALETHLVNQVSHKVSNDALDNLEPHMGHIQQLNASSDSRRAFLAEVAGSTESLDQIEKALLEFGMSSGEAEELSELLLPIQEFPVARHNFLDGDSGPSRGLIRRDAFVKAERMLEKHLDSASRGFDSLTSMVRSDSLNGRDALNSPTLAPYIEAELESLGVTTDPPDAAAEAFDRIRDEGRAAHNRDQIVKSVVAFSAAATLGATGVGGPLAVGLITSTALEMPGVADAHAGVDQSRAATIAGLENNGAVDDAFKGRTQGYAASMGRIAAGSVTGLSGDALIEATNAVNAME